jgi:toxin ParE1/3/4
MGLRTAPCASGRWRRANRKSRCVATLAGSELWAQVAYYEGQQTGLGKRFRTEIEATAQAAAASPGHGKPAAGGARRKIVKHFPFSLIDTVTTDGVLVHAVVADRRSPEYWLNRLTNESH